MRQQPLSNFNEDNWWFKNSSYELLEGAVWRNSATKLIAETGNRERCFLLDSNEFHEQLLKDILRVNTEQEAFIWVQERGFLTHGASDLMAHMLERINALKKLWSLHEDIRDARLGDYSGLHQRAQNGPPSESMLISFTNSDLRVFCEEFSEVDSELGQDPSMRLIDWIHDPKQRLHVSALNTLKHAVNAMVSGIDIALSWDDDYCSRLVPKYSIRTPWQAIGLALMKQVCAEHFTQRFCANPKCNAPIAGRSDQKYCKREVCRKWGLRNLGRIRKGGDREWES